MNNNPVQFKKGLGIARYILLRDGLHFLSQISFYKGIRLTAEKFAIRYGSGQFNPTQEENLIVQKAISKIKDFFCDAQITWDGLFLCTYWYKDSILIGCAGERRKPCFFKIFKHETTATKEHELIEQLRQIYGKWFIIPQIITQTGSMLVYEFIPRMADASPKSVCALLANAANLWEKDQNTQLASLIDLIENFKNTVIKLQHKNLPEDLIKQLSKNIYKNLISCQPDYSVCMIHGDMTPWNLYTTYSKKIAMVDSERVECRSIYTDLLHFHLQPKAMQRFNISSPASFIQYLCKWTKINPKQAWAYTIIYLLEELSTDAKALLNFKNQKILNRAFLRKLSWLKTLLQKHHNPKAENDTQ